MAVHLITGYQGKEHIQSKDARSFNVAMFGSGEFVMEIGEQLEASIINNNTVRVLDGDILMQGGHIRLETDTYEDMIIATGTAGKNRTDLIVMTYEKNNADGTEKAFLEVIRGSESETTPSDPEYTSGVIASGATKNQMPLYRVKIEGVVLSSIEPLFKTIPTYKTLAEEAAELYRAKLEALQAADLLDTMEEIEANTQPSKFAGALAVKEGVSAVKADISKLRTPGEVQIKSFDVQAGVDANKVVAVEEDGLYALSLYLVNYSSTVMQFKMELAAGGMNSESFVPNASWNHGSCTLTVPLSKGAPISMNLYSSSAATFKLKIMKIL